MEFNLWQWEKRKTKTKNWIPNKYELKKNKWLGHIWRAGTKSKIYLVLEYYSISENRFKQRYNIVEVWKYDLDSFNKVTNTKRIKI